MHIGIVNESTLVDGAGLAVVEAAERQAIGSFCASWGLRTPTIAKGLSEQSVLDRSQPGLVVLLDDADQAGALGYHATTPDGKPYAAVFVRDSVADLSGSSPRSTLTPDQVGRFVVQVVDHEVKEMVLDPDAADMVDEGNGTLWAREACDAVESSTSTAAVTVGLSSVQVRLSNHLLPSWFAAGARGPYDALGRLSRPFTLDAGGYSIVEQAGKLLQIFGRIPQAADVSLSSGAAFAARTGAHQEAFVAASDSVATASRTGWRVVTHAFKEA